ncbi:hypothetical protein ABZU76_44915 [Amycolatopsis sp. NPDC005232]|uniref:hypothetical protein n=1 Tax=Amycolatopsis sp. NPDC005232 TaxID=3157027 RepID=UPI0033A7356A
MDVAIGGWGDALGYHVELGREAAGFAWQEIALIHPAGFDDSSWTGYQCLSGDGKFAALAILPASAVNTQAARDHGAFAYSVDLTSGAVRALAGGVGLSVTGAWHTVFTRVDLFGRKYYPKNYVRPRPCGITPIRRLGRERRCRQDQLGGIGTAQRVDCARRCPLSE